MPAGSGNEWKSMPLVIYLYACVGRIGVPTPEVRIHE
jgi:hypothetical protein